MKDREIIHLLDHCPNEHNRQKLSQARARSQELWVSHCGSSSAVFLSAVAESQIWKAASESNQHSGMGSISSGGYTCCTKTPTLTDWLLSRNWKFPFSRHSVATAPLATPIFPSCPWCLSEIWCVSVHTFIPLQPLTNTNYWPEIAGSTWDAPMEKKKCSQASISCSSVEGRNVL